MSDPITLYPESLTYSHSATTLGQDGFDGLLPAVYDDSFFPDAESHSMERVSEYFVELRTSYPLKLPNLFTMNIISPCDNSNVRRWYENVRPDGNVVDGHHGDLTS